MTIDKNKVKADSFLRHVRKRIEEFPHGRPSYKLKSYYKLIRDG